MSTKLWRRRITYEEVKGSSYMSAANYERALQRAGAKLYDFEPVVERLFDDAIEVRSMAVRLPQAEGGDYLVTIRAYKEGKAVVGFSSGSSLTETLVGVVNRLQNRTVKWKADQYGS